MMNTKNQKNTTMMAVAFGPASCSSGLVPKSKLLHSPEVQSGFVPKHSPYGGKNIALRAKNRRQKTRQNFSTCTVGNALKGQ